jgi:hypothetical protein
MKTRKQRTRFVAYSTKYNCWVEILETQSVHSLNGEDRTLYHLQALGSSFSAWTTADWLASDSGETYTWRHVKPASSLLPASK